MTTITIELGDTVSDRVTGFKGVVTGRVEYITGCNQLLISPKADEKNALPESRWIDEQRCELCTERRIVLDNGATPGFDVPAPIR